MPVSNRLLKKLDSKYQFLISRSQSLAPKYGEIPVGGGDWMDYFFKAESVYGLLSSLRKKRALEDSIQEGILAGKEAIKIWNSKREWQVKRWDGWIEDYLRLTVLRGH